MIELFEQNQRSADRQSSKGNQLKWEKDRIWYKADYTGYEGLSEFMISHLLQKSTLLQKEYVLYDLEEIKYRTTIYTGARSENFLQDDWQLITLERLFKNFFGQSLYQSIFRINDCKDRLVFLVEQVERITKLKDFGQYINKLFTIDALFLNEDRHTHNIAVLMNYAGEFRLCPIFDNGAGLLADTTYDYPLTQDIYSLLTRPKAKTICSDFDLQLDLSEELYGRNIEFYFTQKDVVDLLESISQYSPEIRNRVQNIIFCQMKKYQYLFKKEF